MLRAELLAAVLELWPRKSHNRSLNTENILTIGWTKVAGHKRLQHAALAYCSSSQRVTSQADRATGTTYHWYYQQQRTTEQPNKSFW